jgi:hypothetical protein
MNPTTRTEEEEAVKLLAEAKAAQEGTRTRIKTKMGDLQARVDALDGDLAPFERKVWEARAKVLLAWEKRGEKAVVRVRKREPRPDNVMGLIHQVYTYARQEDGSWGGCDEWMVMVVHPRSEDWGHYDLGRVTGGPEEQAIQLEGLKAKADEILAKLGWVLE